MAFETEKFFQKNRTQVIVLLCSLLVIPIIYGIYRSIKANNNSKYSDQVFIFSKTELKQLKEKTLNPNDFIQKFTGLLDQTSSFNGNFAIMMEAASDMVEKNELKEAQEILEIGRKHFTGDYEKVLMGFQLAAVLEDLSQNEKAIELLEEMTNSKVKVLEGKIHLDLGRLYKKVNNPAKAKEKFQYVLNNFDEEVYKKLAQINLQSM